MAQLRVGVNALFLTLGHYGGVETYTRAVMRELPALDLSVNYSLYTPPQAAGSWGNQRTVRELNCFLPHVANRKVRWLARLGYEYGVLPTRAARGGCTVLFSPCFTAPAHPSYASVVTIHDLQQEDLPETFPLLERTVFLSLVQRAAHTATHILTVSEFTKRRIEVRYGIPPERITVSHHAASPVFFIPVSPVEINRVREKYNLHEPYLLSVATLHPHKNLDMLIDAVHTVRAMAENISLVLVGLRGAASDALAKKVRAMGAERYITVTGFVPDADLPALYQGAKAYVMPSRYEGFGIPVLEAMASGIPVITSNVTALPEVAGDGALFFDPNDCSALVAALRRVLNDADLCDDLIARGARQARRFSWQQTAEATLAAIQQAVRDRTVHHPR